tara:strand:- start:503 stop:976 length:474 start_codon:yes stop_codon:yes gene_type:complete
MAAANDAERPQQPRRPVVHVRLIRDGKTVVDDFFPWPTSDIPVLPRAGRITDPQLLRTLQMRCHRRVDDAGVRDAFREWNEDLLPGDYFDDDGFNDMVSLAKAGDVTEMRRLMILCREGFKIGHYTDHYMGLIAEKLDDDGALPEGTYIVGLFEDRQ